MANPNLRQYLLVDFDWIKFHLPVLVPTGMSFYIIFNWDREGNFSKIVNYSLNLRIDI
jgi:hypothetical protein